MVVAPVGRIGLNSSWVSAGRLLVSGCGPGHPQGVPLRGTAGGEEIQRALDESGSGAAGFPGLAQGAGALDEVSHGLVGAGDE